MEGDERVSGILVAMIRENTAALRDVHNGIIEMRGDYGEVALVMSEVRGLLVKIKQHEATRIEIEKTAALASVAARQEATLATNELRTRLWSIYTTVMAIPLVQMGVGLFFIALAVFVAVQLHVIQFLPMGTGPMGGSGGASAQ